jgi:hypothetical protein
MSNRIAIALCANTLALGGCASGVSQVREKGVLDLSCDTAEGGVAF